MKVHEPHRSTQPEKALPTKSFAEILKARPASPKLAATRVASSVRSAAKSIPPPGAREVRPGAQRQAPKPRAAATQAGRQLQASQRSEKTLARAHTLSAKTSHACHDERAESHLRTALFREIERDAAPASPAPAPVVEPNVAAANPTTSTAPSPRAGATERAESIAALVERMEVALKSGQPTMSLGLVDRSGAASIEIARTGKGEVAVRISARAGRREALAAAGDQIRGALKARGLVVKSLTIA